MVWGRECVKHFEFPVSAQQRSDMDLELDHPTSQVFSPSILNSEDQARVCLLSASVRKL